MAAGVSKLTNLGAEASSPGAGLPKMIQNIVTRGHGYSGISH